MTSASRPATGADPAASADDPRPILERALQLARLGRLSQAVPLVQRVLATDPGNVTALQILAYCFELAGRFPEMLAVAEQAAALAPDDPGVHRQLAGALQGVGRARDAVAAAREAHRLDPQDHRNDLALAEVLLTAGGTRNIVAARAATSRARLLAPEEMETHLGEGDVQRRMAEFRRARVAYQRALILDPESPRALYKLATLDSDRGRALRASPVLGGTVRAAPTDPVVLQAATSGARRALWLVTDAALVPLFAVTLFVLLWRGEVSGVVRLVVGVPVVLAGAAAVAWFVSWRLTRLSGPTRTLIRVNLRRPTFASAPLRLVALALATLLHVVQPEPGADSVLQTVAIILTMVPMLLLVIRARNWFAAEFYYLLRRLWFRLHPALPEST